VKAESKAQEEGAKWVRRAAENSRYGGKCQGCNYTFGELE